MNVKLTNMIMIRDNATGKVLALDRVKDWSGLSFPGGSVEPGESFVTSAIREAFEETGLRVTPLRLVDTWNYVTEKVQITGIIYLCIADNPEKIILSDEHDEYMWLGTDPQSLEIMNRLFNPQMLKWDWNELIKLSLLCR